MKSSKASLIKVDIFIVWFSTNNNLAKAWMFILLSYSLLCHQCEWIIRCHSLLKMISFNSTALCIKAVTCFITCGWAWQSIICMIITCRTRDGWSVQPFVKSLDPPVWQPWRCMCIAHQCCSAMGRNNTFGRCKCIIFLRPLNFCVKLSSCGNHKFA